MTPPSHEHVDDDLLRRAKTLSSATLHEAAQRVGALPGSLRPIVASMHMAGRAFPVRCPTGDNLWIHRALASAGQDDVLVIDAGPGGASYGYWGEVMANAAIARGIAGIVITGGVRDSLRLAELGLPTFPAAITIRGTGKAADGDGSISDPVRIGEIMIRRGDLIVGDADGIVALSPAVAARAIPLSEKRDADEIMIIERVRAGATTLDVYTL